MLVSQAHSFTQQARLAITLAWVAGFTNILSLITCAHPTSHVSGTTSEWGRDLVLGEGNLVAVTSFLLGTFLVGAMLSGVCTETGRRRGWESIYVLPIAVQAVLLAVFAVMMQTHVLESVEAGTRWYAMTGLASLAMGLQNATITRISGGVVRTTHMTGVFTDLGLETVQFLYWLRDRKKDSPPLPATALVHSVRAHPTARRLALLGSVIGSFALGAGLGAAAYEHFPKYAMLLPVAFLMWIIIHDVRTPICEIEPSTVVNGESEWALPSGLAVFHLRKDRRRKGAVHRLPDLLRWWDGLGQEKRVVILDLGDMTEINSNAALELRAMIKQAVVQGRRVVVTGVTAAQYRAMREAGAGDALDQTTVCADLELAVARGLGMLEEMEEHAGMGLASS